MAVRIDKTVSQNESVANNLSTLQSYLLRRAGRKLNDVEYIGLLRNNALSDLEDPGEALTNILEYITRVDDAGEIALYGTYKPEDFEITRSFVQNEITSDFLKPLADISIAGGAAGAAVATNPRIRIQDRTNLLDSFTGKGSISGLAKGPTAIFYRTKPGKLETLGTLVFSSGFDLTTGVVTSPTITWEAGYNNASFTGYKHGFLITSYLNASTSEEVSLLGTGLFLEYDATGAVAIKTGSDSSLSRLKEVRNILGAALFNATTFTIEREYSALVKPDWFSFSPASDKAAGAAVPLPGGPDDFNPATSDAVVYFERGKFKLYTEPEYYNSGNYVFDRIPIDDRDAYSGNNITKDSNMRFMRPPRVVRANTYNWGVRWDGYLRLDKAANPRKYIFEVETNTGIKIDIYDGGVDLAGEVIDHTKWEKAFDSSYGAVQTLAVPDTDGSVKLAQETDRHVSRRSFTLDGIEANTTNKTFRYDTALDASTQIRYVPISIRMWNGGVDRVDSEQELFEIPLDPNLFLKYAYSETDPSTQDEFFAGDFQVSIATDDTTGTVTAGSDDRTFIDDILGAANAKVSYSLVKKIVSETITYIDADGNEATAVRETEQEITPIPVLVTGSVGGNLTITDTEDPPAVITDLTDAAAVVYTVRVTPDRSSYSYTTLWSTNIIGPKQQDYQGYADLLGGKTYTESDPNYIEPLTNKLTIDQRPEWWKVSDGNRFLPGTAISKENNPLDGFKSNSFSGTLRSSESPAGSHVGLYGDGAAGTSRAFSNRRNIVFGEAKYSGDQDGSNYLGLRLTSNFLGEGGKLNFTGIPINNATFDWTGETENQNKALGQNDLGGGTNHRTAVSTNLTVRTDKFYWDGPGGSNVNGTELFFLHPDIGAASATTIAQDNPLTSGLPAFGGANDATWAQPIIVIATSADGNKFEAPLVLGVQKVIYDRNAGVGGRIITDTTTALSGNQVYLLAFSTSFEKAYTTDNINGLDVTYHNEADVAFQFASVDTGESISFSDVLKATYTAGLVNANLNPSGFNSSASEVPKVPSERVTPFGFDSPIYTPDICYPPYVTSSPDLKPTVVTDAALYSTSSPKPPNHFDVFWGNHTEDNGLSGTNFPAGKEMVLNITEKLEFAFPDIGIAGLAENPGDIVQPAVSGANVIKLNFNNYSHRLKIELPIFDVANPGVALDEDVYVHIGDQSKVKDVYYLFVNGRNDLSDAASGNRPGLQ